MSDSAKLVEEPPRPARWQESGLVWVWISALIVVADQITKFWAEATLSTGRIIEVAPFWNFFLAYNKGAAFSFLGDAGGWQRWLFAGLAIGVSLLVLHWLRQLQSRQRWQGVAFALIIGGAIGNLYDRVFREEGVVDFIDWYIPASSFGDWPERAMHWPTFNIADSAIVAAVIMIFIDALLTSRRNRRLQKGTS